MEMLLLVGAVWCVLAAGLAVLIGKAIAQGNDDDAPAHIARRDWQRVSTRRP